ncbi:MAG: GyrI-like domain-containing protein [Christensenella sp.]|uniref:GyrI-like domain-containing protein n=1 Tax=Christensenella sp. TaxID=1935934 RepID=UPI002B1ECA00|nr:GyrI-like domain-containing protein [Christensenella sp.]MEA5002225.1 GyrI-like domain-containing protein [Christensenella sp.]
MEIVKVYKESMPHVKLIGKRYTNEDRDETGTFAGYWQQWFAEGWFDILNQCKGISGVSEDFLGAMRMTGADGSFEYWIGAFLAPDADVPEGFDAVEISAGEIGVCWLYGNEKSGELFGMDASNMSMAAISAEGWKFSDDGWFMERYNSPRFTTPDEKGNVILDICAYLV